MSGDYSALYLTKSIPGIVTINSAQINQIAQIALVSGDSNGDNQLSILDYNIIFYLFQRFRSTKELH